MEDNQQKPVLRPGNENPNPKKGPKFNIYWIYGLLLLAILGAQFIGGSFGSSAAEHSFQDFKENLEKGQVDKLVVINNDHVEVYLKPGAAPAPPPGKFPSISTPANGDKTAAYTFKIGTVDQFNKDLQEAEKDIADKTKLPEEHIPVMYDQQGDYLHILLQTFLLPVIFIVAMWFLIFRKMGTGGGAGGAGGIFNIGKSKAQLFEKGTRVNITFNDVAGLDEAKVEVMEIVDFLKNPKKYTALGGKIPKGALLVGPSRNGQDLTR